MFLSIASSTCLALTVRALFRIDSSLAENKPHSFPLCLVFVAHNDRSPENSDLSYKIFNQNEKVQRSKIISAMCSQWISNV